MKKIIFALLVILFIGCNSEPVSNTPDNMNDIQYGIQIKEVNNCQYIVARSYQGGLAIVHAANCNNPTHIK